MGTHLLLEDTRQLSHSTAEELTQILCDALPQPSILWNATRKKKFQGLRYRQLGVSGKTQKKRKESSPYALLPLNAVQNQSTESSTKDNSKGKHSRNLCMESTLSEALQTLYKSNQQGIELEDSVYALLRHCAIKKDLAFGREVHSFIIRKGLQSNSYIAFHLMRMFSICGSLMEANQIFNGLSEPDVFLWTAMISAYANIGEGKEALILYEQMLCSTRVKPGTHVIVAALKACSSTTSLHHGMMVHADAIREGFELDAFVGAMLIGVYACCNSLDEARKVFDMLPKGNEDVAYSAMMTAYKAHGSNVESLEVFGLMQRAGVEPDNIVPLVCAAKACSNMEAVIDGKLVHCIVTEKKAESNLYAGSALIGMYVKCGSISEACNVFERLPEKNEVTWSSMISAFAEANDFGLASAYFEGMQKAGIKPNGVTFLAVLSACSHTGTLSEGVEHFNSMWEEQNLVPMGDHYNCLVDLLGRTGNVVEAEDLLHTMPNCPDAIGCMALLSHCKTHGNVEVGKMCFHNYVRMDLRDASSFSLMTEIYSDCCMAADAELIEKSRVDARAFKKAGRASICIDREVHTFDVGSLTGQESDLDISTKLGNVHAQLKMNGYFPFLD